MILPFLAPMILLFTDAAKYYKQLPHQIEAWNYLQQNVDESTLDQFTTLYRNSNESLDESGDSWQSIERLAREAGAKFPELAAAQWALESSFGSHVSGRFNYFGIKGAGTLKQTWEDYGNGPVYINDEFRDFNSPSECVKYLVTRWYQDYNGYTGINRAQTRDEAAYLLKAEGYATDPKYTDKLIDLMNRYA